MPPHANEPRSLLSLPDEILDLIFMHSAADGAGSFVSFVGICRKLRPFAELHLYRSPCDWLNGTFDEASLESFDHTLRQRSELRKVVQQFRLKPVVAVDEETRHRQLEYLHKEGVPKLAHLLLRLPNVTHVAIEDFDEENVDELLYTLSCMPRVSDVNLLVPRNAHDWSEDLWSQLAEISSLTTLTVKSPFMPVRLPSDTSSTRGLQALRKLCLDGCVEIDNDASLTTLAPNLEELRLSVCSASGETVAVRPIFTTAPASLHGLSLHAEVAKDLALLPGLRKLELDGSSGLAEALADLARSRIEVLVFSQYSSPAEHDLAGLLDGLRRMRHLRRLVLDYPRLLKRDRPVIAMRTKLAKSMCSVQDVSSARRLLKDFCTGWRWGMCDAAGLERVLEAASAVGVTVSGDALTCLEWDRLVVREFRAALVDRIADAKSLLVEYLDNDEDVAAAEIRQHRPELPAWFSAAEKEDTESRKSPTEGGEGSDSGETGRFVLVAHATRFASQPPSAYLVQTLVARFPRGPGSI